MRGLGFGLGLEVRIELVLGLRLGVGLGLELPPAKKWPAIGRPLFGLLAGRSDLGVAGHTRYLYDS